MAASYPSSPKSFGVINNGDTVTGPLWTDAYDEVTAIEQALLTSGLAHDLKFVDALLDIGKSGATRPRDLFLSRNLTIGGTLSIGGVVTVATQPRASAYHSTTQSLSNSTETAVLLDSEDYDVGTMHDTVTNNSRLTVPSGADGLYLCIGQVGFAANATSSRRATLRKNGTAVQSGASASPGGAADVLKLQVMQVIPLVATDYIELYAWQNSGGNLNAGSATRADANSLSLVKLW